MKLIIKWYAISVLAAVAASSCNSKTGQTKSEDFPPELVSFGPYQGNAPGSVAIYLQRT